MKNIKKYDDYEKSRSPQLNWFSELGGIYEQNRNKYSATIELYDLSPKFYHGEQNKIRTKEGFLPNLIRSFQYREKSMEIEIRPAQITQKDKTTKLFYPSYREEIVEDAVKKLAINKDRNELLDSLVSVRFTLYELQKELKKMGHLYRYPEIVESLEILSATGIKIKHSGEKGEIKMSSNMFETFGSIDKNNIGYGERGITEEQSEKIVYFVRFNALVNESIKDGTWRLINYEQCMSYKTVISRYLHKRISHMFLNGVVDKPYNIMISTLYRDSGLMILEDMWSNKKRVMRSLEEMKEIGSIDKYKLQNQYDINKKNKVSDIKILLWISESFYKDIQRGFLSSNNQQKSLENSNNNNNNDTDITITQNNKLTPENTIITQKKDEIKNLIKEISNDIKETDINKIINNKNEKELSTIRENIIGAKHYINKLKSENSDYTSIAIIKEFIKKNWKINDKDRQMELSLEDKIVNKLNEVEIINKIISNIENKTYREISKKSLKLFGKSIYREYFLNLKLIELNSKKLILSTDINYVKETIEKEYLNGIYKYVNGESILRKKGLLHVVQEVCPSIKNVEIILEK
ncbi:MAG: hypothetical protein LBQ13_00635 [Endomicrobium sp.]|jgi:hypothetical protein|nr:hypothetical protein [Endomicrobium sp.]